MNKKFNISFFIKIVKNVVVFFITFVLFICITEFLPKKEVKVDYAQYNKIEKEKKQITKKFNELNSEYNKNLNNILEKKDHLISSNEELTKKLNEINDKIEEFKE